MYDATTTTILDTPPYLFFTVIGVVFATSAFILLLLKYDYFIPRYTKIFLLSSIGLILGAALFGGLSNLYSALASNEIITIYTFMRSGIVFYGGMIGFLATFLFMCRILTKKTDFAVLDIVVVCIPLFHFFGRLGCFFAGCCYGIESSSLLSIIYTNQIGDEAITASRIPVQLFEAVFNFMLFTALLIMLSKKRQKNHLVVVYLIVYAIFRIFIEFLRGDEVRGVWNGISFSQVVSVVILLFCGLFIYKKIREKSIKLSVKIGEKA